MQTLILTPAYGRRYNHKAEALADWKAGRDFKIVGGPYCSIRDIVVMKRMHNVIVIRWGADVCKVMEL